MTTMSEPTTGFDKDRAAQLLAEAQAWQARSNKEVRVDPDSEFAKTRDALKATLETLPETVQLPYSLTPEGERWEKYKRVCDEQFLAKLDYTRVQKREPFDRIANWDGRFPGPCGTGPTGLGKSRAAWWALRQLYVRDNRPFAWFPVRRLVTELERYEKADCADEFFRAYDHFRVLFVDDIDKINWDFESHSQMLFAFLDWVYRKQKPVIITTNRDRDWWTKKMGDAFVRRLFNDACFEVKF